MEYRLTTLQYELQENEDPIEFTLSKSAVGQNHFQSLTYSVSIQKLSKTLVVSPKKSDSQNQNYYKNNSKPTEQDQSPTFRIKLDKIAVNQSNRKLFKKKRPSTCQMIKHVIDRNLLKSTKGGSKKDQNQRKMSQKKIESASPIKRKYSLKENNESMQDYKFSSKIKKMPNYQIECSTASTFNQSNTRILYPRQKLKNNSRMKVYSYKENKLFPYLNSLTKKSKEAMYIEQTAKWLSSKFR